MARIASHQRGLGELLRRIVTGGKQYHVAQIAAALQLTPRSFFGRLQRGARFTPDEIAILLREIQDDRLIRWLWGGSGLLITLGPARSDDLPDPLLQSLLNSATECIAGLCDLALALEAFVQTTSYHEPQPLWELERHIDRAQAELLRIKMHRATDQSHAELPTNYDTHDGFAALVNQILLTDNRIRPRDLADALGLTYHALHSRISGRASFVPEELKRLFQSYPHPGIADYLLVGTRYTAIPRPALPDPLPGYSPIRAGLLSLREIIKLLGELLRTANVRERDVSAIMNDSLDKALRQLATMHWTTTHIGHRPQRPSSNAMHDSRT